MTFDFLKNIFKRKTKDNRSVGISTIDTSFIDVPKLREFTKKERKIILKHYKMLTLKNYEDLIKFSSDLANKYSFEQEILLQTINRYDTFAQTKIDELTDEDIYSYLNNSIISKYEYNITIQIINEIRRELFLRLTALDLFIKKEERKKLNPLSVFHQANRMEYIENINRLLNERDRIKKLITQNTIISVLTHRKIEEKKAIQKQGELYKKCEEIITNNSKYEKNIKYYLAKKIIEIKTDKLKPIELSEAFNKDIINNVVNRLISDLDDLLERTNDHSSSGTVKKIDLVLTRESISLNYDNEWLTLLYKLDKEQLNDVYQIIANYLHRFEIYCYEHRNDYKDYLKEMTDIIDTYEKTESCDWDLDVLEHKYNYFKDKISKTIKLCSYYLSDDIIKELNSKFLRLEWLYALRVDSSLLHYNGEPYYDIAIELLSKLEKKYNVKLENNPTYPHGMFTSSKKDYILSYAIAQFDVVYDLLNGYFPEDKATYVFHKKYENDPYYNWRYLYESTKFDIYEITHIKNLYNRGIFSIKSRITRANKPMEYQPFSPKLFQFSLNSTDSFNTLVSEIKQKMLEKRFSDNRLLVIPSVIEDDSIKHNIGKIINKEDSNNTDVRAIYVESTATILKLIKTVKIDSDILLFINNNELDNDIMDWTYTNDLTTYSIKERSFNDNIRILDYNKTNRKIRSVVEAHIKIVVFPDDATYGDYSNYLDSLLEKETVLRKVAN